jgi:hypothetical protein
MNSVLNCSDSSHNSRFDIGLASPPGSIAVPDDFYDFLFPPSYAAGARIHSNSWGGGYWYDAFSIETDAYLYDNQDFVILFAGGNNGGSGYDSILSPGLAKNCVAVGSCINHYQANADINTVSAYSSIGPAPDGRIKPDVIAPGDFLQSAMSSSETSNTKSCKLTSKSGTSMATPAAAGQAALVKQFFENSKFWLNICDSTNTRLCKHTFTPQGALIKAVLLHSGSKMSTYMSSKVGNHQLGNPPDIYQGYGRINLSSVLPLKVNRAASFYLYVDQNFVSSFTERQYLVTIKDPSLPLKVTLSWYDPPNEAFSARVVLHDLDLIVEDPDGIVYYGNDGADSHGQAVEPDGYKRDEINNNEQITIRDSASLSKPGNWLIRVQAKILTESSGQNFALVVTIQDGVIKENSQSGEGPKALPPEALRSCAYSSSVSDSDRSSALEVDVSLWDLIDANGWGNHDNYVITSLGDRSSRHRSGNSAKSQGEVVYTGYFKEHEMYKVDTICLVPGCYSIQLNMLTDKQAGTSVSIPHCDLFLGPLFTSDEFCIEDYDFSSSDNYADYKCNRYSALKAHAELPIQLAESNGEGWQGAYFSILVNHFTFSPPT